MAIGAAKTVAARGDGKAWELPAFLEEVARKTTPGCLLERCRELVESMYSREEERWATEVGRLE